jgi:hypothetical protein
MTQLSRAFVCCCAALILALCAGAAWGQAVPVYVSGGQNIYTVSAGSATTLLTVSGANFESLAIGPDNADTVGGNASHLALLYACDSANNRIYRLDPATPTVVQQVYSGGIKPLCGRSTSKGDFEFTDKLNGGVWQLSGVANSSYSGSSIFPAVVNISTGPANPRGITQKYVGDLLVVDNTGNEVLRYSFPTFSPSVPPTFNSTNSNLNSPVGLARASTGEVFVSNSVLAIGKTTFPPVAHFNRDGSPAGTCSVLNFSQNTNQVPAYLATAPTDQFPTNAPNTLITDNIYLVTFSSSKGTLWSWNTASAASGNCSLNPVASVSNALTGVAVAPAAVELINTKVTTVNAASPTPTVFDFNSSQFWLTGATGPGGIGTFCTANVTATPLVPATVSAMVSLANTNTTPWLNSFTDPATPASDLGGGGYETVYVAHWLSPAVGQGCTSVFPPLPPPAIPPPGGVFETSIFGFYDVNLYNNPRMVQCDNGDPTLSMQSTEPQIDAATTCGVPATFGVYPVGGPIPGDGGLTSRNSFFATVNEKAGQNTASPGTFCGFQPPLTGDGITPPSPPPSFSAGTTNTVNVKFKLSSSNCKKDFISNAVALISIARIADATGATVFNTINPNATASSILTLPLFNSGNNQYSFTLNLPSVFAQGGAGTYIITVTFLTDNTTNQITSFQLTP